MLVPRLGAIVLLMGLGFAAAQILQLVYVVAVEGHSSWLPVLAFLAPSAVLATASAVLVLLRNPLGARLVPAAVVVVLVSAVMTFLSAPPVGRFLDDYEQAALARGVEVPQYRLEQGWDEQRYIEQRTADVRSQGTMGALAAVGIFAVLVRTRITRRFRTGSPAQT